MTKVTHWQRRRFCSKPAEIRIMWTCPHSSVEGRRYPVEFAGGVVQGDETDRIVH
jgi:hypothetical protein